MTKYPNFDSLPKVEGQPQGSAWGLWGQGDELGSLNYLTPDVIKAASQEIRAGLSVQLDLRLDHFGSSLAGRQDFEQKIIDFKEPIPGSAYSFYGHDDVLVFNTQQSSQWDGLRHVAIQESATYYQGMKHDEIKSNTSGRLGIHKWVENGGIVGRGVLLDFKAWRERTGQPPAPPNSNYSITAKELDTVAKFQGTELRTGDILLIRSGYLEWFNQASPEERRAGLEKGDLIGMESSMTSVKWLWNHHFAAVATDAIGFEPCPIHFSDPDATRLHDWLLGHWGTPIGELWNLEKLSDLCQKMGQWSFFFTSAPLHVFGGVGSPPNAIAIL